MISRAFLGSLLFAALIGIPAHIVQADELRSVTTYGNVGLIDTPTAQSQPDAEITTTLSYIPGSTRTTLTFQMTPRLSGSFRYGNISQLYDRSFDLRYRLLDEGRIRPALAIGLNDFVGTGVYSGEYLVASKHLLPNVLVSGGIGWGRLASSGGFSNPLGSIDPRFRTRPLGFTGDGGQLEFGRWFRGDAAFFGGLAVRVAPRLILKAEYSSDAYGREVFEGVIRPRTPYNFGLDYKLGKNANLQLSYLHGDTLSAGVTLALNPKRPSVVGGTAKAPPPVRVRLPHNIDDLGWTQIPNASTNLRKAVREQLAKQGIVLDALAVSPRQTTIRIRNGRYQASAEAIGRTARVLSQMMPDSVETFKIVPVQRGMVVSEVSLKRSDIEAFEHAPNGTALSYKAAAIQDAAGRTAEDLVFDDGQYPRLTWSFGPYLSTSFFDPGTPIRAEVGLQAKATYVIRPGLEISGALRKRATGNKHTATRVSDSTIRRVRSDVRKYARQGDPSLKRLTLSYYFRPGKDLYGRVTAGYLETMYGGISTEVLWKPVDSPFALGAELNYVKQRDFDQLFGFQAYEVATGHLTGYWDMGNGFEAQGSVGRYLGGDVGGTLKVERVFKNGWRVGAYATLTDVPFADFGEGSFDKGLTFTIPFDHFIGTASRRSASPTIQPILRDGGAKLNVDGRLYGTLRGGYHRPDLVKSWGRFWR